MGSGQTFDEAVGEFAVNYADQNQKDYRAFLRPSAKAALRRPSRVERDSGLLTPNQPRLVHAMTDRHLLIRKKETP